MRATAKVFMSGNSQAVRLPKAFRFDVDEVEIVAIGTGVFLSVPTKAPQTLNELMAALNSESDPVPDFPSRTKGPARAPRDLDLSEPQFARIADLTLETWF